MANRPSGGYYLAVTIDGKATIERFRKKKDAFSRAAVYRTRGLFPTVHEWPKENTR